MMAAQPLIARVAGVGLAGGFVRTGLRFRERRRGVIEAGGLVAGEKAGERVLHVLVQALDDPLEPVEHGQCWNGHDQTGSGRQQRFPDAA